jgi:hypothetical protein
VKHRKRRNRLLSSAVFAPLVFVPIWFIRGQGPFWTRMLVGAGVTMATVAGRAAIEIQRRRRRQQALTSAALGQ